MPIWRLDFDVRGRQHLLFKGKAQVLPALGLDDNTKTNSRDELGRWAKDDQSRVVPHSWCSAWCSSTRRKISADRRFLALIAIVPSVTAVAIPQAGGSSRSLS